MSVIAGVESGARLAAAAKGGFHAMGFHPTSLVGAFASALVAGKLFDLDEKQLTGAQGIALSLASGSLQFVEDGSWTKRLHPGWAAACGITAASLAADDIPAPREAYEGRYGLYRIHLSKELVEKCDLAIATAGLGEWAIDTSGHTELEQRMMREWRWFARDEIARWPEPIFPEDLTLMLETLA